MLMKTCQVHICRKHDTCHGNLHKSIAHSGLPKVIFLDEAEAEGEGGKTSALKVKAKGEAEGLVFCI